MDLSEHSETTANLANGYQDGYQMIMHPRATLSDARAALSLGKVPARVLDHASEFTHPTAIGRQRVEPGKPPIGTIRKLGSEYDASLVPALREQRRD